MSVQRKCSLFVLLLVTAGLMNCKPQYPNCKSDDHCRVDSHLGDVCVNGTCQECLEDIQCTASKGDDFYCNAGRCDARPEEVSTCAISDDCTEGYACQKGICVEALTSRTCEQDLDCDAATACIAGTCQERSAIDATLASSEHCRAFKASSVDQAQLVNFAFNNHELSQETITYLQNAAECLKDRPTLQIVLEGHCDERGTQEYNLALGEKRANTVKGYLRNLGVATARIQTRTLGENKPRCLQPTEECYSQNRRVEFIELIKN